LPSVWRLLVCSPKISHKARNPCCSFYSCSPVWLPPGAVVLCVSRFWEGAPLAALASTPGLPLNICETSGFFSLRNKKERPHSIFSYAIRSLSPFYLSGGKNPMLPLVSQGAVDLVHQIPLF
jgi:hypothetical protein